jgi:NarL family two-component system sensor histidine kinase YdfH
MDIPTSPQLGLWAKRTLYLRTMSAWTIAEPGQLIYNEAMSTKPTPASIQKVERDPRLFMWFMTLVVMLMYVITLVNNLGLRSPWPLFFFTALVIVHLVLHWALENLAERPHLATAYVITQGILAFVISWMANETGMVFALFMALIGESIGLFRITRAGILAVAYYLALSLISFSWVVGWNSAGWWLFGAIISVIWVGVYVTLYIRQLEAREQAQSLLTELEAANRQLSEYAAQVEDLTLATERQRMARELHDTLSQGLAGLILQLEAADAHLTKERPERAEVIIQEAMEQARGTLADARRAIGDLRSSVESVPGLEQALGAEVKQFEQATGLPCELEVQLNSNPPSPIVETGLRIVSEALTNVARHAQAAHAWVQVNETDTQLCLEVRDDGQGFDPEAVETGHYGLLGMRERARLVGGGLDVSSEKGRGTAIKVWLPLSLDGVSHE